MLFGDFREGAARRVTLEDVDGRVFGDVLDLWCGKEVRGDKELADVMMMASVADRLQMAEVVVALEDAIRRAADLTTRPALKRPAAPNQAWQLATLGLDPLTIQLFTQTGDAAGGVE